MLVFLKQSKCMWPIIVGCHRKPGGYPILIMGLYCENCTWTYTAVVLAMLLRYQSIISLLYSTQPISESGGRSLIICLTPLLTTGTVGEVGRCQEYETDIWKYSDLIQGINNVWIWLKNLTEILKYLFMKHGN